MQHKTVQQAASISFISTGFLQIVMRKLPRAELRRYVRETPFNRAEVTKLWLRFSKMDMDGSGTVTLQASLPARTCCHLAPSAAPEKVCYVPCILDPLAQRHVHGSAWQPCVVSFSQAGQQACRVASAQRHLASFGRLDVPAVPALLSSLPDKVVGGIRIHSAAHSQ